MESKPKSRRGRKPKIREDEEPNDLIIRKKRGRKKKCEMYLENNEKISGYNPNGESIDIIQDRIKFGHENVKDDSQFENISFGLLQIKRHNNVISNPKKNVKELDFEKNKDCLINFDIIVDNIKDYRDEDKDKQKNSTISKETLTNFLNNSSSSKIVDYKKSKNTKIDILEPKKSIRVIKMIRHSNGEKREIPKQTNIWCWWCCHPFDTIPRFLPTKHDEIRNRFQVIGNFCSWSCVKAYDINENQNNNGKMLLSSLVKTIHGKTHKIHSAPPRAALKVFGGDMTIEEFRRTDKNVYYEINTGRLTFDENFYIKEIPND